MSRKSVLSDCERPKIGSCLFCASHQTQKTKSWDRENVIVPKSSNESFLEDHLQNLFILRHLLDISEDKCFEFLSSNGGNSDPGTWFAVCSSCTGAVKECYQLHLGIQTLNQQLDKMREKLKGHICDSRDKQGVVRRRKDVICFEIRREVLQYAPTTVEYSPPNSPGFVADDNDWNNDEWEPNIGISQTVTCEQPESKSPIKSLSPNNSKRRRKRKSVQVLRKTSDGIPKRRGRPPKHIKQNLSDPLDSEFIDDYIQEISHSQYSHQPYPTPTDNNAWDEHDVKLFGAESENEGMVAYPEITQLNQPEEKSLKSMLSKIKSKVKSRRGRKGRKRNSISGQSSISRRRGRPPKHNAMVLEQNLVNQEQVKPEEVHHPVGEGQAEEKVEAEDYSTKNNPNLCDLSGSTRVTASSTTKRKMRKKKTLLKRRPKPAFCELCSKTFTSCKGLDIHKVMMHSIEYERRCSECPAKFSSERRLEKHSKLHAEGIGFACQVCMWLCPTKPALTSHQQKHLGGEKSDKILAHKCPQCPASFSVKILLKKHSKNHLEEKTPIPRKVCHICGWYCSSTYTLRSHLDEQHPISQVPLGEEMPFYCDHCHMIFTSRPKLLTHIKGIHKNIAFCQCDSCDAKFENKQLLEIHRSCEHSSQQESITGADSHGNPPEEECPQPFPCPHCSEIFPSVSKRDYHIAKDHRDKLLTCPICNKFSTDQFFKLNNHLATHRTDTKAVCDICAKTFSNVAFLRGHRLHEHYKELNLDPILCDICNISFPSKSNMKVHKKLVHDKLRPHCCEYCGKGFASTSDLRRHILLHTAPREDQYKKGPFFCKYCPDVKFNVRQALYYHMKRSHSDTYEFRCDQCGNGYVSQNILMQHQKNCKMKPE